ncbi:MAG: hypothetical protein Q7R47_02425, partial [Candidatus Diapherotrites archaeon]|nr:hypothetical protein [Candidatus Diapherotrites archaeon]
MEIDLKNNKITQWTGHPQALIEELGGADNASGFVLRSASQRLEKPVYFDWELLGTDTACMADSKQPLVQTFSDKAVTNSVIAEVTESQTIGKLSRGTGGTTDLSQEDNTAKLSRLVSGQVTLVSTVDDAVVATLSKGETYPVTLGDKTYIIELQGFGTSTYYSDGKPVTVTFARFGLMDAEATVLAKQEYFQEGANVLFYPADGLMLDTGLRVKSVVLQEEPQTVKAGDVLQTTVNGKNVSLQVTLVASAHDNAQGFINLDAHFEGDDQINGTGTSEGGTLWVYDPQQNQSFDTGIRLDFVESTVLQTQAISEGSVFSFSADGQSYAMTITKVASWVYTNSNGPEVRVPYIEWAILGADQNAGTDPITTGASAGDNYAYIYLDSSNTIRYRGIFIGKIETFSDDFEVQTGDVIDTTYFDQPIQLTITRLTPNSSDGRDELRFDTVINNR